MIFIVPTLAHSEFHAVDRKLCVYLFLLRGLQNKGLKAQQVNTLNSSTGFSIVVYFPQSLNDLAICKFSAVPGQQFKHVLRCTILIQCVHLLPFYLVNLNTSVFFHRTLSRKCLLWPYIAEWMLSKYTAEILATAIHNGVDAQQLHSGNTCSCHTLQSGLLRKDTAEMLARLIYSKVSCSVNTQRKCLLMPYIKRLHFSLYGQI